MLIATEGAVGIASGIDVVDRVGGRELEMGARVGVSGMRKGSTFGITIRADTVEVVGETLMV